ncbi:MAG: TonB-dependent receptor [Candidatus Zixiibacteriota bacterium]|nr:MAG: TonB-dependent receptor [candidate division Zixibacteria bacterium]
MKIRPITKILSYSAIIAGFLGSISVAENLKGRVIDSETNSVLRDVNIRVIETGKVVASDKTGHFLIRNLDEGRYRLVATHIAYDMSDTIIVNVPAAGNLEIKLKPSPWVLNDVVITGTRTPHLLKDVPVQTEVVSQRDFERTGATTVDEALNSSIGITINEDLSGQGATLRGIEGDRVLVLVDGERAVGRVRGSIDLSQYSLNNVEKIEVVKGTGSTLYGSDAMGGVINIITKRPSNNISRGHVYFDYGSHTSFNPAADFEYGNDRTGVILGAKLFSTNGFDLDESTPHTNGQEQIDRLNFSSKARHAFSPGWDLVGSGRFMYEKRNWIESEIVEKNAFEDTTYTYDDEEVNKRYEASATLGHLAGDKYSAKLRLFGTYYDHSWDKFADSYWIDTSNTEDIFLEASFDANYVIGQNHVTTYGLNYNRQDLKSSEVIDVAKADDSYAGYLQYEYSPHRAWNFVSGIRYENHSSFGGHINPSINVMFKPTEQMRFRGFVGRGFRAPSIKQQYFIFDHTAAGYIVYGGSAIESADLDLSGLTFEDLRQETSINSSISAEFSYGTIGLHRITYFYNHLEDLIDFTLIGFPDPYWRGVYVYQNIATAVTQGVEWESRIRLSPSFDLSFSYNYLYTRNLETQEKLINRPDHTFKFYFTGLIDRWNAGVSFWGDYQSRKLWVPRSNTGGNEGAAEYAPHRTRLNLNIFKRFDNGFETFVRLENLLDETNIEYGYWPGFEFFAGIKFNFSKKK